MKFYKIVIFLLNLLDNYKTRKILKKLSGKILKAPIIFDVGAHKGESIDLFLSIFKGSQIYSFEINNQNYNYIKSKKKYKSNNIKLYNFGFSNIFGQASYFQTTESSSSTLSNINFQSKYLNKKLSILGLHDPNNFFKKKKCTLEMIDNFFKKKKIKKIDLLKIDTEGHEFNVLLGAKQTLSKIKFIYFEHHYDDMIKKNYKFSDINNLLLENNFKQVLKSKMYFRKTFEYIYENISI